ncbi:hypothetical protein G6F66_014917 [Rhizopus arrhizus]|nr:hypothetical protein G6F66_014917 [Rhizopus arrhizus]
MHRQPQGSAGSGIGGGDVPGRRRPGYRAPRAKAMAPVRPHHPQVVTAVIAGRQPFTFQPLAGFHGVAARAAGQVAELISHGRKIQQQERGAATAQTHGRESWVHRNRQMAAILPQGRQPYTWRPGRMACQTQAPGQPLLL